MNNLLNLKLNINFLNKIKRFIHISSFLNRRPPQNRSTFRKIRRFPFFNVFYDTDSSGPKNVIINETKLPPGNYGSIDLKLAWKQYKQSLNLRELPTYFDKLRYLTWNEFNCFYNTIELPLKYPETLDFAQFITRTKIMKDIPDSIKDSFNNISSEEIKKTSVTLKSHLENYFNQSAPFRSKHDIEERHRQSNEFINQLMDTVVRSRKSKDLFQNYSCSPNSIVETFLKRSGYDRLKVSEMVKDADGYVKYRIRGKLAWQLRSRDILKEFIKMEDKSLCNDGNNIPLYDYNPKMFGLEPKECEQFTNLPFTYSVHTNEYARNIPGYWGNNPFKIGDPCAFSVLGVINTDLNRNFEDVYGFDHQKIIDRHRLSEAIFTGFTWTMAQAQNQGFTIYDEITYPFCSCLLLTNGQQMQMVYYQLNSISSLWKPEDANFPTNAIWIAPKINLYDVNLLDVVEINEHAIHQILSTFIMPKSDLSTQELQPYLKDVAAKDLKELMIHFDKENATEIECEEYKKRSRHMQIFKYTKSHPNRIFYFEKVQKYNLDEEFRQLVPGVDNVPLKVDSVIKNTKLKREIIKVGKKKALVEPSKWQ